MFFTIASVLLSVSQSNGAADACKIRNATYHTALLNPATVGVR